MRSPSLHSLFATQRLQRLTDGGSTQHAARCAYLVYLATAGWALAAARFLLFVLAHAVLAARPTSKAAVAAIRVIIGCRSVRVSGGGRAAKASRAPGARECRVYVANHVTDFDGYVLHGSPAALPGDAVGLFPEAYGRIPLLGPALVALARRVGYLEVSADRAARRSHLRAQIAARVAATSILVFPEGALTNGKAGVLRYSQFVFSLGIPVQPIALRVADPWPVNYDHIHTNWTTGRSSATATTRRVTFLLLTTPCLSHRIYWK